MPAPVAYFLTWTCRGTWLHGDERLSVDEAHRSHGTERVAPSVRRRYAHAAKLAAPPLILSKTDRAVVDQAIRDDCAHRAVWLGACNVRSNHVHCVVGASEESPERLMQRLKAWATRRLREHDGARFARGIWTRRGSTRYLWTERDVESACVYVVECQDLASRWERPDG